MGKIDLHNINIPGTKEYSTGTKYEPIGFYFDALSNSIHFDLLLGYFSSSAISLLSIGFTKFLLNGGKMRLVINQFLKKEDKEAINKGIGHEPHEIYGHELSLKEIRKHLDDTGEHFFNCIAYLISKKRIEIQIVKPKGKSGISHYKSGLFSDGTNDIVFRGSCNFTANALMENLEEIGIKTSWEESEKMAVQEYKKNFNKIFDREADYIEYLDIVDVEDAILKEFGEKEFKDLLEEEIELINSKSRINKITNIKTHIDAIEDQLNKMSSEPKFPFPEGPREYQAKAYENWVKNDKKGIFAMDTGTGKTITSLNCLLEEYKKTGTYQAVVTVPTIDLLKQWAEEIYKFNFVFNIIKVGVENKWKKSLSKLTTALNFGSNKSFIIIVTYDTFYRATFQNFLNYLPKATLLIADETHNIARPTIKPLLPKIKLEKRIGLSATPKRIYDDEGTEAINKFFHDNKPYTYEYTMEEAIINGVLSQYEYYPHIVSLTEKELDQYKEITQKLLQFFDPKTKQFKKSDMVTSLLMKRKRIIHKAENKLPTFRHIIKEETKNDKKLEYTFVYVPEGFGKNNNDEQKIIADYNQAIMDISADTRIAAFTGQTENREQILNDFESGKIGVLSAMKCLDEGVDVPRTELAIFCSSTANPKQFIQRRGRILRNHYDKKFARIHDLIVIPRADLNSDRSQTYNMEKSQVENEIKRLADFANMALNRFEAFEKIQDVCKYYEIDINRIIETNEAI